MELQIEYLADHPDRFPAVAEWIYGEWSDIMPYDSSEEWLDNFRRRVKRAEVPTTFLAFDDGEPVGSASLTVRDLPSHMHLTPWLAEVFVRPEHRSEGVGSALVKRVEEEAARLGAEWLFLYTFDSEPWYESLGWQLMERCDLKGEAITIMKRDLTEIPR